MKYSWYLNLHHTEMRIMKNTVILSSVLLGMLLLTSNCRKENNNSISDIVPDIVKDIDGNVYHTVIIGTQVWMIENLKTTKYRDGNPIPNVTDGILWSNLSTGAFCYYNNDESKESEYGLLYNWYAVNDGREIAPKGWHVPTNEDWIKLTDYLGGSDVAGGKMKEAGFSPWHIPNTGATNLSGFTALPGSSRSGSDGSFLFADGNGFFLGAWWSSTKFAYGNASAWMLSLSCYENSAGFGLTTYKVGYSVRCVKD